MYQKHICRPTIDQQLKYYVHKAEITYDERVAYAESVSAVLSESRFGRVPQRVKLSNRPELEPAVFFDLNDSEMMPYYALLPLGRKGYQASETEYRKAKVVVLLAARPNGGSGMAPLASNLGRGSPGICPHLGERAPVKKLFLSVLLQHNWAKARNQLAKDLHVKVEATEKTAL